MAAPRNTCAPPGLRIREGPHCWLVNGMQGDDGDHAVTGRALDGCRALCKRRHKRRDHPAEATRRHMRSDQPNLPHVEISRPAEPSTTSSSLSARHGSPQDADCVRRVLGLTALAMQSLVRPAAGCNRPPGCAGVRVDLDHVGDRALLALGDIAERDQRPLRTYCPVGEGFPGVRDSSTGFEGPVPARLPSWTSYLSFVPAMTTLTLPPATPDRAVSAGDEFCDSAVRSKTAKTVAPTSTTHATTAIRTRRRRRARCLASSKSASTRASTSWRSTGSLAGGRRSGHSHGYLLSSIALVLLAPC